MEERVVKQNYKKLYPTAFILYLSFFVHGLILPEWGHPDRT